jgi:hypothetical protein
MVTNQATDGLHPCVEHNVLTGPNIVSHELDLLAVLRNEVSLNYNNRRLAGGVANNCTQNTKKSTKHYNGSSRLTK